MNIEDKNLIDWALRDETWLCPLDDMGIPLLDITEHLNSHGYFLMEIPPNRVDWFHEEGRPIDWSSNA